MLIHFLQNRLSSSFFYHFFFSSSESHFIMTSSLFWLLAEMLKQATVLFSLRVSSSILSTSSCSFNEPSKSFLLPRTSKGMPVKLLFCSSQWSWALAKSMLPKLRIIVLWSKESNTKMMTSESLQNFSQLSRNLVCPPKSHSFIETFPACWGIRTFFDFVAVEANGGDCIFFECAVSDGLDQGSFSCILESDYGYFEFLIEKFSFEPRQHFIKEADHFSPPFAQNNQQHPHRYHQIELSQAKNQEIKSLIEIPRKPDGDVLQKQY